jgi:lysozyme
MIDAQLMRSRLIKDEALRLKPYLDTVGRITAGIGRNLSEKGIGQAACDQWFAEDVAEALAGAEKYSWFAGLDLPRRQVIVCMIFNMGAETFASFDGTQAAFAAHDWPTASTHMLGTKWASEVGQRAVIYARIVRTGIWE